MGSRSRRTWSTGLVAVVAMAAAACGSAVDDTTYAQPAPEGMMVMTDAMVADVFTTSNNGEIEQARLALNRAQDARVRDFAQRMIDDHSTANDRAWAAIDQNTVRAAGTDLARQLRENSRRTTDALRTYEGAEFDRAYVQAQVNMHRYVLETLDNTLIPAARNRDLDRLLTDTRPVIAEHLRLAQDLLRSL